MLRLVAFLNALVLLASVGLQLYKHMKDASADNKKPVVELLPVLLHKLLYSVYGQSSTVVLTGLFAAIFGIFLFGPGR